MSENTFSQTSEQKRAIGLCTALYSFEMSETSANLLELVAGRRGHFRLESGYHSSLWLDLDPLFTMPQRVYPLVAALASALRPHAIQGVCGPLLGGAFLAQLLAHTLGIEFYFTQRVMPLEAEGLFQASYHLPPAFSIRINGKRLAIVDDVISAGSALRGTYTELHAHGALPVVVGALFALGTIGTRFFEERGIAVHALAQDDYQMWHPAQCPLCAKRFPLEDVSAPGV